MLRSILLIGLCLGSLVIYSPDELKETIEITIFAAFGNPSIYNTVGKLVYSNIASCAVTTALDSMSFALIDVSKIKGNAPLKTFLYQPKLKEALPLFLLWKMKHPMNLCCQLTLQQLTELLL